MAPTDTLTHRPEAAAMKTTTDPNPATCTDREWWDAYGACGGCGAMCHPGPCGSVPAPDPFRGVIQVCDLCPTRVATGQVTP